MYIQLYPHTALIKSLLVSVCTLNGVHVLLVGSYVHMYTSDWMSHCLTFLVRVIESSGSRTVNWCFDVAYLVEFFKNKT